MSTQEHAVIKPLWHAADKEKWRFVRATYWERLEKLKPSLMEEERWVNNNSCSHSDCLVHAGFSQLMQCVSSC